MTKQHKALELADAIECGSPYYTEGHVVGTIRRQHVLLVQMREALIPLANASSPQERECISDLEQESAVFAIAAANEYLGEQA